MAIKANGTSAGYLSGGCIDADIVAQAQKALQSGHMRHLRYGQDSPFADLQLPCNGALEVVITPHADNAVLVQAHKALVQRQEVWIFLDEKGALSFDKAYEDVTQPIVWRPKMGLRIAGRGADCLALSRLAQAGGFSVSLAVRDGPDFDAARKLGLGELQLLSTPAQLPPIQDDPWTAFALMFHEREWEIPLLHQALAGPAFYVGALGSPATHNKRREKLMQTGVTPANIARIHAPIGMVPSLRNASMLAVSVLAEIINAWRGQEQAGFADTGLVLLAAGLSTRFEAGDKLLADAHGAPLLYHAASALCHAPVAAKLAVIGPDQSARHDLLQQSGWDIVNNPEPGRGRASSLMAGVAALSEYPEVKNVLILLADMPAVSDEHLRAMKAALDNGASTLMSEANGVIMPPALFPLSILQSAHIEDGELGARQVFGQLDHTATIPLGAGQALDVDTVENLRSWRG